MKSKIRVQLGLALVLCAGTASAQLLDLAKAPLFLSSAVDPNLMVTFDDSGSMTWGYTPDGINGSNSNCGWRYRRFYSAAYNKQYYNPDIVYSPPLYANGDSFPGQSFANASTNGFNTGAAKVNLGSAYFVSVAETGSRVKHAATATATNCSGSYTYTFPTGSASAFYCTLNSGAPNLTADTSYTCKAPTAAEQTNFANWFAYYRYRANALKSAVSRSFGALGNDIRVSWQNMNNNAIGPSTTIDRFESTRRTDFFNWLYGSPTSGNTPTLTSVIRAGEFFRRSGSTNANPYWDTGYGRELMCRQNFHVLVTDGYWNQSTHPSAGTAGASSILKPAPLPDGRFFTPGVDESSIVWNEDPRDVNACNSNVKCTPSYSDLAFHYWASDLSALPDKVPSYIPDRSTGVTGPIVDPGSLADLRDNPEIYWNPKNDPATWQHVVQFFIGFGVDGLIPYSNENYLKLRKGELKWSQPRNLHAAAVDDSWHGAMASRGQYFGASDPNQIVDALSNILESVVARKGSSTAVSVSTGIINSASHAYNTQFDSTDWSGTVIARPIRVDPHTHKIEFGDPEWDAGCMLTGGDCVTTGDSKPTPDWDSGRTVLTSKAPTAGAGVPFRFGNLSAAQQAALNDNPASVGLDNDGLGARRLDYLRGDRNSERSAGGTFRNRNSLFGAVVNSSALIIKPPSKNEYALDFGTCSGECWEGGDEETAAVRWEAFVASVGHEPKAVVVGANDGMLHVLNASTGSEYFAYVPHAAYPNLSKLTYPQYQFEPTVDGQTYLRPVFTKGRWRNLLVGTMRRGGQSVFALDVTSPSSVTEGDAADVVQWEFSDQSTDGANMGFSYGQPYITRLHSGKWVVLVPASYNNQHADSVLGDGHAWLFVLDASNGAVLHKFDVSAIDASARALGGVQGVTLLHEDITDFAYAGDLAGNIWRFDVRSKTTAGWAVSKLFEPAVKGARPITAAPRAEYHPVTRKPMIFVGTGKYLESTDRSTAIPTQAFYGIVDLMSATAIKQADMKVRKVESSDVDGSTVRKTTGDAITNPDDSWQVEFDEAAYPGERVVARASLNNTGMRVIFSTLIPPGDDPCVPGGKSFVMFADIATGMRATDNVAFFDTNNSGRVDEHDNKEITGVLSETMVPGVATVVPAGGGVGGVVIPGGDGTPTIITTREFEWRRRSFQDRTELQGED